MDGKHFYLSTAYGELVKTYLYVVPEVFPKKQQTYFQVNKDLLISIEGKICLDVMSGIEFETRVVIKMKALTLIGCGKALY